MSKFVLHVGCGFGTKSFSHLSFYETEDQARKGFQKLKHEWLTEHGIELTDKDFRLFQDDQYGRAQRVA